MYAPCDVPLTARKRVDMVRKHKQRRKSAYTEGCPCKHCNPSIVQKVLFIFCGHGINATKETDKKSESKTQDGEAGAAEGHQDQTHGGC